MVESDIEASDSCSQPGPVDPGSAPGAYLGESLSVKHVHTICLPRLFNSRTIGHQNNIQMYVPGQSEIASPEINAAVCVRPLGVLPSAHTFPRSVDSRYIRLSRC